MNTRRARQPGATRRRTQRGGNRALLQAVKSNNLTQVQALLATPDVDVNIGDKDGLTPLYIAVRRGLMDIFNTLLADPRVDVNKKDNFGWSPLHSAAHHNYINFANALLADPRIDVNASTKIGETPLFNASFRGFTDIVMSLLADPRTDINIPYNGKITPLYAAATGGHVDTVRALLADPRIQIDNYTRDLVMKHKLEPAVEKLFHPILDEQSRGMDALIERHTTIPSNLVGKVIPFITGRKPKNYRNSPNTRKNGGGTRRHRS